MGFVRMIVFPPFEGGWVPVLGETASTENGRTEVTTRQDRKIGECGSASVPLTKPEGRHDDRPYIQSVEG